MKYITNNSHTIKPELIRKLLTCLITIIIFISLFQPLWGAYKKEVVLGVLAHRGIEKATQMWQPTAKYLESQISGYNFTMRPLTLTEMEQAVSNDELDFILTNTGNYINLEASYNITRVATLKNMRQGAPFTSFGAVIFVKADRQDIQTIDDLKGKSFAAVSKKAFGGFQMAWRELKNNDIYNTPRNSDRKIKKLIPKTVKLT